ncbi:zinc finger, C4 type, partial [Ancylostoma caninum]
MEPLVAMAVKVFYEIASSAIFLRQNVEMGSCLQFLPSCLSIFSRFFRRTVRKRHAYSCRFNRNCVVDKAQRNTCRSCRFDECMRRGMRKEAVQSERDRIRPTSSCTIPDDPLLDALLSAEAIVRQLRSSVITRTVDARRQATTCDVTDRQLDLHLSTYGHFPISWSHVTFVNHIWELNIRLCLMKLGRITSLLIRWHFSMNQQLTLMVEWAKQLQEFQRLPLNTQVALLSRVAARIVDHLTTPMRKLQMNEIEYVALKAIALFDP